MRFGLCGKASKAVDVHVSLIVSLSSSCTAVGIALHLRWRMTSTAARRKQPSLVTYIS